MDTIDLPLYRSDFNKSLAEVLSHLKERQRGGLVLKTEDQYQLFYLGDLLECQATGATQLSAVQGGKPIQLLHNNDALTYQVDLIRPQQSAVGYTQLLKAYGRDYALAGETDDVALLITRSEQFGYALRVTGGYQCNGTPTHFFPYPRVVAGQTCPKYPECQLPDNSVTKIVPLI
jgi:hypothetical protein